MFVTVSHKFGFGLIDGMAMVEAALSWVRVPQQLTYRSPIQRDFHIYAFLYICLNCKKSLCD